MRNKIAITIGLAVSGFFLWLAIRDVDFPAARNSLSEARFSMAIPFLASLFTFYWLKSSRWALLLSPAKVLRTKALFPVVMIGYAGTAILPMQLGELVRAMIASSRFRLPVSLVLSSIGVERIADLLTILALLGIVLATGQSTPEEFVKAGYVIGAITVFALSISVFLVLQTELAMQWADKILAVLPEKIRAAILKQLVAIVDGLGSLNHPALIARVILNSLIQWGLMGFCIWMSLLAVDIHIPMTGVILVLVSTIIGISLPTSPGYVGNIQLAFVVALQAFGISPDDAIVASIFYHVLAYVSVLMTGGYFAHRLGYGLTDLDKESQDIATN